MHFLRIRGVFLPSRANLVLGQEQNFVDEILNKFGVGIFDFATITKASEVGIDGEFYRRVDTVVVGKVVDFGVAIDKVLFATFL